MKASKQQMEDSKALSRVYQALYWCLRAEGSALLDGRPVDDVDLDDTEEDDWERRGTDSLIIHTKCDVGSCRDVYMFDASTALDGLPAHRDRVVRIRDQAGDVRNLQLFDKSTYTNIIVPGDLVDVLRYGPSFADVVENTLKLTAITSPFVSVNLSEKDKFHICQAVGDIVTNRYMEVVVSLEHTVRMADAFRSGLSEDSTFCATLRLSSSIKGPARERGAILEIHQSGEDITYPGKLRVVMNIFEGK